MRAVSLWIDGSRRSGRHSRSPHHRRCRVVYCTDTAEMVEAKTHGPLDLEQSAFAAMPVGPVLAGGHFHLELEPSLMARHQIERDRLDSAASPSRAF
eukprot:2958719-Amphidinium_carterae.1